MWEYLFIGIAGFLAFYIKGLMGVGTTTVLLSLTALVIDPKLAIVLTAFANIFGGTAMLRVDPVPISKAFWIPIAALMFIGSIFGAMVLKIIDNDAFALLLGCVFILLAFWFVLKTPEPGQAKDGTPDKARIPDNIIGFLAGLTGGFIGINVPIMATYFGRFLNKQYLRRFFVLVYLPAAIAQTLTYVANGLFTSQILIYGLCLLPGLGAGIYLGNKAHYKIPELWFRRILAVFLLIVSLKLIF